LALATTSKATKHANSEVFIGKSVFRLFLKEPLAKVVWVGGREARLIHVRLPGFVKLKAL
jgi:hypothetical protein